MKELWFLHSARCLMLIDIYMTFHEDSLSGFQDIEPTWSKENNTKSINARVKDLALCMLSNVD